MRTVDRIRGIPGQFDIRLFTCKVRVTTWSGSRIGQGTATIVSERLLTVGEGQYMPKVRQVTQKDILASGGKYTDQDFKVGPLTPPYLGGGVPAEWIDPPQQAGPTEVIFLLEGPGMPPGGGRYKRIGDETDRAFHYNIILRHNGQE